MMPNMMSGMGTSMFLWLGFITLLCILTIGACIWFAVSWLKKHNGPTAHYTPQPRDAYEEYEQGYQPQQQQPLETYQEGDQYYSYPQNEKLQTQFQEMEQRGG
jgi:hypothetical protein